jgi:signal transduction histidine kinase
VESLRKDVRALISVARMDAGRVNVMADDLLDIARLEASDALELEPVPSGELVRKTVTLLEPMAAASGITLQAEVEPGLPVASADGRRLARALENLLRNAIDHATSQVQVAIARDELGLRFEVRDDGPGLPEHDGKVDLEHLDGRRARDDSAGLGLLVTRRVAEAHGGRIGAYNLPSGGAAVWFAIPLHSAV